MALTYRSPIEEVLTLLEPAAQSLVASTATTSYQQSEKDNFEWFHYSMPAIAKEHLSNAGIYLSPYSGYPHSHPVCKTLENYLLYKVVPSIINNTFYFVGIKQFKLNFLKKRYKSLSLVQAINRYVSSADKIRYGNEFVVKASTENRLLKRHGNVEQSCTIRDLVPNIKTGANLFVHDELHYWSKDDLIDFLEVCKPETLLGTIVYPTEIFMGAKKSLNPWCYEFEIKGDRLVYYPDRVRSEAYDQPLNGAYLLQANRIELQDGTTYCIDLLTSKFSHHLVSLTRGNLVVPKYRSFGPFEAVHACGVNDIAKASNSYFPVSQQNVLRVYRYLRSLKKPDKQSAMAKFSQLCHEPSGEAIKFMEEFSSLVIDTASIRTNICAENLKAFFGNLGRRVPSFFAAKIAASRAVCLDEFIACMKPLSVDVNLQTLKPSTLYRVFIVQEEVEEGHNPVVDMENEWAGLQGITVGQVSRPYRGLAPLRDCKAHWVLRMNIQVMRQGLLELYMSASQSDYESRSQSVEAYIGELKRCTTVLGVAFLSSLKSEDIEWIRNQALVLDPKGALWWRCSERWFKLGAGCRTNVSYIESNNHVCSRNEFEACPAPGRKTNFSRYTCMSYQEDDIEYVEYEPVRVRPLLIEYQPQFLSTSIPELCMPIAEESEIQLDNQAMASFNCECGISMPVEEVVGANERIDEFTDELRGRAAAWYSRGNVGYAYNGGKHKSKGWPKWLSMWMQLNGISDKYDCMLAQRYEEGARIGYHADDEAIFEPGESICTVNMVGSAVFKVRCSCGEARYNLDGAVKFEMPKGFQVTHKHAVEQATEGRISYTFRVLKLGPKEGLEVNTIAQAAEDGLQIQGEDVNIRYEKLGPNESKYRVIKNQGGGDCFWLALEHYTSVKTRDMKYAIKKVCNPQVGSKLEEQLQQGQWAQDEAIRAASSHLGLDIVVLDEMQHAKVSYTKDGNERVALLKLSASHFEAIEPLEACTIKALAECVDRDFTDVSSFLYKRLGRQFMEQALAGIGLTISTFREMLVELQICALVELENETIVLNEGAPLRGAFQFRNNHATYIKKNIFTQHERTNVYEESLEVTPEMFLPILETCTVVKYTPEVARATILADSFHQGSTGVLCSELFNEQAHLMPQNPNLQQRELMVLMGVPGCGKSRAVRATLPLSKGRAIMYITPRKALLEEFNSHLSVLQKDLGKMAVKNFVGLTFERALLRSSKFAVGGLAILDEIQLYPPGYLDLLLCNIHESVRIVLLGDPCQSDYDSKKDRCILGALQSDVLHILDGVKYKYNILSHRFQSELFVGRLPCEMDGAVEPRAKLQLIEGLEAIDASAPYANVCLVSSFDEKKIVNAYFGGKCKAYTFGESTGANFTNGCILLTGISQHTNERRWVTALSRFRGAITIVNATGTSWEVLCKMYANRSLGRFLSKSASKKDLSEMLPGEPQFTRGFTKETFGADEGKREEKLQGDPWLKTMVDLLQVEDLEEVEMAQAIMQDEWCKTHLPQCELEGVRARWVHKILAKEFREKRMGYLVSEQFTDEHSKQPGRLLTNAAERFEAIYPRHRAADTVTFVMAVRKRLRFSNPVKEASKLNQAMPYGPFLLKEFLKRVPLKPAHDTRMMADAKFDFEEKKTSKSAATIENHSNRSMREWAADMGLVFSKSQLCTKFDNRFRDAKAAQTIVCFQHAVLCRFAPHMRYIEKKLKEVLPEKYYIHSGKGLEELNDWVIKGGFGRVCTESDYEAFDASQDQYIMAFEICLMRYLGLPNDLVEDYRFIKTHLGSKLGNFAIMRFSGEASTFLFNTMANMLFTFLQYDIKGDERICFAGDDMCSNKRLFVSKKHADFLSKLKLKAKVDNTTKPTFCGWNLCPDGIFKKPQLVLERLCIAKEMNNLINCIDNYAIEVAFAYKMGERAKERMSEEEVDSFYNCVRIIVKNKHLLKSDVRDVFQEGLIQ